MLTYGDAVSDVNIIDLLKFYKTHNKIATVTTIRMDPGSGGMDLADNGDVISFGAKARDESKRINCIPYFRNKTLITDH